MFECFIFRICSRNICSYFKYKCRWTFTLVTVYFGVSVCFDSLHRIRYKIWCLSTSIVKNCQVATAWSIYGCIKFADVPAKDPEDGTDREDHPRELAGFWTYVLQILYQVNAFTEYDYF
jgi:hypothetical protein